MDMLTFSKEREPEPVPSDVNEVVGDVVELVQARAELAGVKLVENRQADIPLMTFDPEGLHRAVLNVVTNGIEACEERESGTVEVSTQYDRDRGMLRVIVQDNGEGMDPDQAKRIFNVFESGKGNRGTGLGLAVSQKILQEHQGQILVESEPGRGSTFSLELPASPADATGELPVFDDPD
jgi:signal transduction histidine kinase